MSTRVDTVIFNGVKFRRYPDSRNRADREYYRPSGRNIIKGVQHLHREIWKSVHGPIPGGYHVHHVDGNPLNNDIGNLDCKPGSEHLSEHVCSRLAGLSQQERNEHMAAIRPLASLWHKSKVGREWHKEHAKQRFVKSARKLISKTCAQCGAIYETFDLRTGRTFCSANCRSAWRRRSGKDDVEKTCVVCGKTFKSNRYGKIRACSRLCGTRLRTDRASRSL